VRRYSIVDDGDGILQIVPSPKEPKEGSSPS
jgi:hypothetical protein